MITGVAAGRVIVYAPVATALLPLPVAVARALIVSVADTVIGPLYTMEFVVGVLPSVV